MLEILGDLYLHEEKAGILRAKNLEFLVLFMKHKNAGNLMRVKFRKLKNAGHFRMSGLMKVPKTQKNLKEDVYHHHEAQKSWKLKDFLSS